MNDSAFNYLAYGVPYTRSGVLIQSRQDGNKQVFGVGSSLYTVKRNKSAEKAFSTIATKQLDDQSIQKMTAPTQTIADSVVDE